MSNTVSNAGKTVVTKVSGHVAVATEPDMCFVPGDPVAKPFDNYVKSELIKEARSETVTIDCEPVCLATTKWGPPSDPAHAGEHGGQISKAYRGPAQAKSYSTDCFVEGEPVVRKDDDTEHNEGPGGFNTVGIVIDAAALEEELEKKHGRDIEPYCRYLSGYNESSRRLAAKLPEVAEWLNAQLKEAGYDFTVTEEELAANLLGEGGDLIVNSNLSEGISGYSFAGIDTVLNASAYNKDGTARVGDEWADWIPSDVQARLVANPEPQISEQGESVVSASNLSIEDVAWTNAGMYVANKVRAAGVMSSLDPPVSMASLPRAQQLYWSGLFFNSSRNTGPRRMRDRGVDGPYELTAVHDKNKHLKATRELWKDPHYNVKKRVASYELMAALCGASSPQ